MSSRTAGGRIRIPGRYRTPIPRTLLVVALILVVAAASLIYGSYEMTPEQVFRLIFQGEGTEIERQLVLNQRLPRMLAAIVVGAALGLSGAIFQSVSRNALGSPDIIGFTVGSATGALSVVLIGPLAATGVGMGMGAILGGFVTAAVVMLLAGLGGGATMGQKMVLIGIAVSAMLSSVNDYLITRGDLEKAEASTHDPMCNFDTTMPIEAHGRFSIGFNGKYLRQIARAFGTLRIEATSPGDAAHILTTDPDLTVVLMPMRV